MKHNIEQILKITPGLKGREIAKKIGTDKKSVNSFLHAHTDDFIQDNNYGWSLVKPTELRIEFEGNQWLDCNSFETSLGLLDSPLDSKCDVVIFVVLEKCNILLDTAARLLALCNQLVPAGKAVTIDFSDSQPTLTYFDRIGFLDHLDKNVTVLPERPTFSKALRYKGNSEAVVEFGTVDPKKTDKELVNQLTNCFVQQSDSRYEMAAFTVFSELIGNVSEHSETPIQGFAAFQMYSGGRRKHIQTVVSDSGLGIAATLKPSLMEHYPTLHKLHNSDDFDIQLVTAVLTKGNISRFGSGRGLGFKSSREQTVKFDARLSVRQETFSIDIEYKNGDIAHIDKQTELVKICGTHLCFDFFVD